MLGFPPLALSFAPPVLAAGPSAALLQAPASTVAPLIAPLVILLLCVVAGVGTVLLLPGRREGAVRKIGGALLLIALVVLGALLFRAAAGLAGPGVNAYFWPFAIVGVFAAVRVVTHPRPVYSALYFVLCTFATAGLYVLLWAEFMAAALILIYAGAILVTYVFVIMLAQQSTAPGASVSAAPAEYDTVAREPVVAATVGFALMAMLLFVILDKAATPPTPVPEIGAAAPYMLPHPEFGYRGTQAIAQHLFGYHMVNLELAGLLLTLATVGAIVIARRRMRVTEAEGLVPDVWTGPYTPGNDDPHSIPVYGTDNPRQKAYPET